MLWWRECLGGSASCGAVVMQMASAWFFIVLGCVFIVGHFALIPTMRRAVGTCRNVSGFPILGGLFICLGLLSLSAAFPFARKLIPIAFLIDPVLLWLITYLATRR